ncbi:SIS domain-containing protein [Actinokineospora bangkokensis]|uniref:Sugar isomerase n=1 Tax=Actinokineospora bangkokensis TaxID=1193682 RepID=A0A1Q9LBP1_9PSEU|nr:sugar isomerase [Actinokineospora bangkokensis]OLR89430.1 sugar isomerase [Actinokineospora bangkokensis]
MSHVLDEIAGQPGCWRRAAEAARPLAEPGQAVAVVGCGTSWFMAMAYAALREAAGHGRTDAFAASEFPAHRDYDRVVAITRSGTTTEVLDLLRGVPATVLTANPDLGGDTVLLDYADERSVVQTRFATTALAYLRASLGADLTGAVADAEAALGVDVSGWVGAEQVTFLGRGWTVGLAHEAALKLREAASAWTEAYPAMEYRHGPISVAQPGRLTWMFGAAPAGLAADVERTGAGWVDSDLDPMAHLVVAQRLAVAVAERRGLDPDHPRHLTRSVVLPPCP